MKRPWFLRELAARVRSHPDAVALEDGEVRLTYREMWEASLRVGGRLAAQGLGPEDLIGLQIAKSPDYVVALLGVWQCGAAFLPLDTSLPSGRLAQIRELAGCSLVLTELPTEGRPAAFPAFPGPDALAYVIYTSGSTGAPKGVEITHTGLPGLFRAQIPAFAMNARSRVLWLLSMQFDASLSDLGCTLLAGGTLCFPQSADVAAEVARQRITHVDIPPALLRVYRPEDMPGTTLIVGGEASEPAVLRAWAVGRRLVQVYGPTEATICTSLARVDAGWDSPRLGRAIWGMHHRVYEEGGAAQLSTGELCINGPGLARGYRGQPELTAARFVELEGRRYYRTGDRVRWLGGDCEFLGRLDRQFKHQGRLIEPQEVELQAMACAGVSRAALVWPSLFWSGSATACELQAHLRERLPAWMVPEGWRALERLPETSSGKVDLEALSDVSFERQGMTSLEALQKLAELHRQGQTLSPEQLLQSTPADLTGAARLRDEVSKLLDGAILENSRERASGATLITGATGFLGSHLLERLLETGEGPIYCAVRNPGALPSHPRIVPIKSDLTLPDWDVHLPDDVSQVYHLAAQVNTVASFNELRAVNLDSLAGLIRYLARGPRKHLHFASTLSVLVASDRNPLVDWGAALSPSSSPQPKGLLREEDDLTQTARVYGGYAQSKWAAEWLVRQLPVELCDVTIYRYGLLTAHSQTGEASPHDFLRMFGRGLLALGAYPRGADLWIDITPVDFAVQATHGSGTRHIANPVSASLRDIVAALGSPLEEIAAEEFFALEAATPEAAAAQLALCRYSRNFAELRSLDLFQATGVRFQSTSPGCPAPTPALLALSVRTPDGIRKGATTPESGRPDGESSQG